MSDVILSRVRKDLLNCVKKLEKTVSAVTKQGNVIAPGGRYSDKQSDVSKRLEFIIAELEGLSRDCLNTGTFLLNERNE